MKAARFLTYLLISFVAIACYDDSEAVDTTSYKAEPKVYVNTGVTGKVVRKGAVLNDYHLQIAGVDYEVVGSYFYHQLDNVKRTGTIAEVVSADRTVGLSTMMLVANDLQQLDFAVSDVATNRRERDFERQVHDYITISGNGFNQEVYTLAVAFDATIPAFDQEGKLMMVDDALGFVFKVYNDSESIESIAVLRPSWPSHFTMFKMVDDVWQQVSEPTFGTGVYMVGDARAASRYTVEVSKEGEAVAYQPLRSSVDQDIRITSVNGRLASLRPWNESSSIEVLTPCGAVLQSLDITAAAEKANIAINSDGQHQKVKAQVVDCNGNITAIPAFKIINGDDGRETYLFGESQIDNWVPVCGDNFTIAAIDPETGEQGPELPWSLNIDDDIDYLSDCSSRVDGYSLLSVNGEVKVYPPFQYMVVDGETMFMSPDGKVRLRIRGDMAGGFQNDEVNIYINDEGIGAGYYINCEQSSLGCGLDDFYITHLEETDGWIRASFSGTMWMQKLSPITAGNYQVEGQILIKS